MHKATKFMAAIVLTMGLAACGGGAAASSAASTADTASAASTADATSAASTADATSTASTADATSTTTTTTSTADYTSDKRGTSFTAPAGFTTREQEGTDYMCITNEGESVNIIVTDLSTGEDFNDASFMAQVKDEFVKSIEAQGFEGFDVQTGTQTIKAGTFPACVGTGQVNGTNITIEQVYVQNKGAAGIFTVVSTGTTSIEDMMAGLVIS